MAERRDGSADRIPLGDRQPAFGEPRDSADDDHREHHRGDQEQQPRERQRPGASGSCSARVQGGGSHLAVPMRRRVAVTQGASHSFVLSEVEGRSFNGWAKRPSTALAGLAPLRTNENFVQHEACYVVTSRLVRYIVPEQCFSCRSQMAGSTGSPWACPGCASCIASRPQCCSDCCRRRGGCWVARSVS